MLLENKVAVIYGAGSIGAAVARAFAREGARVFVANRSQGKLDSLAEAMRAAGLTVETALVDALDEQAVNAFVDGVMARAGRIDISFNLIALGDVQQPLMEIALNDFLQPILIAMRTHFLTTRAAARHMAKSGGGVVLAFGGGGPQTVPGIGGFKIALDAIEGLRRQWAVELGAQGIRVVTIKTGGITETIPADMPGREELVASIEQATLLKRAATLADVGAVAAFLASDQARMITATEVNISGGSIME
jgi:NAD(P)-dependent dehydrogenase (short-subunit alcohol dehydrogenase family)